MLETVNSWLHYAAMQCAKSVSAYIVFASCKLQLQFQFLQADDPDGKKEACHHDQHIRASRMRRCSSTCCSLHGGNLLARAQSTHNYGLASVFFDHVATNALVHPHLLGIAVICIMKAGGRSQVQILELQSALIRLQLASQADKFKN